MPFMCLAANMETRLASLRLQHCMIGTLVLPCPFVGVCFGTAAGLGCTCLAMSVRVNT